MHELVRSVLFALAMILTVPAYDGEWPTLGWDLIDWMRGELVHGPGDIRGEPLRLDDDKLAWILRFYEVFPEGHERAGQRRFDRCGLSIAKGLAKTELGALISIGELSPEAPVRCAGFRPDGSPIGRSVNDPFIPMVAYTEEQSDELAYGAMRVILLNSRIADQFDIGLERIVRKDGSGGKAVSLASSPGARDGARTTFQLFDETHRFTTPELRKAHQTMLANIPKRSAISDPWTLELTTAYDPSERSVAQATMNYAKAVHEGRVKNSRLFYFHRQGSEHHDLTTPEGRRAMVLEARGPYAAKWSNIDAIVGMWDDPEADKDYLARVWGNQIRHSSARAFDVKLWERRTRLDYRPAPGARIALGFDGAQTDDSTALIATEIFTGFQWPLGIWERPFANEPWHVPEAQVDAAVEDAFKRYDVWKMYADPFFWENWLATWANRYGEDRVVRWPTNHWRKVAQAVRTYTNAMTEQPKADPGGDGEASVLEAAQRLSHDGNPHLARHIANAFKMVLGSRDEKGEHMHSIQKERKDSPNKMDAAMAAVLSWECRVDAITEGADKNGKNVYNDRAARGEGTVLRWL